jgi:type IV pilus assembly protein PilE
MKNVYVNRSATGFTLIELMVAVAIIGILTAVALPSYKKSVLKSQRSVAKGGLMQNAQTFERYYTTKGTYTGASLSSSISPKDVAAGAVRYNISAVIASDGSSFTLTATPTTAQAADECGTLALTNTGAQTPTTAGCW